MTTTANQRPEYAERPDLRQRAEALKASVSRHRGAQPQPGTPADPVFAAIAASKAAEEEMAAFQSFHRGPGKTTPVDFAEERRLGAEQLRAEAMAFSTVPTTRAGHLALLDYVWRQIAAHGYADGRLPDDDNPMWKRGFEALSAALGTDVRLADDPDQTPLGMSDLPFAQSVEAQLISLNIENTAWWGIYNQAGRAEDLAAETPVSDETAVRKHMAEMAEAHAIRKCREVLVKATNLPASTVFELGLQARLISVELNEWWDDNQQDDGELACRTLLDRLMGLAGVTRILRDDLEPARAQDWLDHPAEHYPRYHPKTRSEGATK